MLSLLLPLVILPVLAVKVLDEEQKAEWANVPVAAEDWSFLADEGEFNEGWDEMARWKELIATGMGDAWTWGPYDESASIHQLRVWFGV